MSIDKWMNLWMLQFSRLNKVDKKGMKILGDRSQEVGAQGLRPFRSMANATLRYQEFRRKKKWMKIDTLREPSHWALRLPDIPVKLSKNLLPITHLYWPHN